MSRRDFEKLLLEAVDEALTSLGESSKQAIFFHLEKNHGISMQEIPSRVDDFVEAVEKTFGLGAKFLEILIMRHLCDKLETTFDSNDFKEFTFKEYIAAAKRSFEKKTLGITQDIVECQEMELDV